ncbi:hypothetical protein [Bacteriovorax sp. Seq25_V]|uniref:hypothetical protein n=1 Tax=Bacteriovorax sp. Seq25_V TaxID=1201288 RepID=UPI00038A44FC|nr:hypothetical protein [Bacteriovorax sp. Seq25_V]EQC44323.1 hypothetical protein M900_A0342 [Bacteriovorax sp. Seq25_V]
MNRKSILLLCFFSLSSFALEQTYFNGKIMPTGTRELSIIVTDTGYYPKKPIAFVGEKVKIFVTSTTKMPSCLILKNKEVYLEAKKGELAEGEVFLDKVGDIEIYCPTTKHRSTLVVLEHPKDKEDRIQRQIASEKLKGLKIWRPKDD